MYEVLWISSECVYQNQDVKEKYMWIDNGRFALNDFEKNYVRATMRLLNVENIWKKECLCSM